MDKGRGRVRIQVHCLSGPCHPPQVGGWFDFIVNSNSSLGADRFKSQTKFALELNPVGENRQRQNLT